MVTPVYIKKYAEIVNIIYYHVQAPRDNQDFFIGIDTTKKTLAFFTSHCFDKSIKTLDLSGNDVEFSEISGISSTVSNFVTAKVFSALLKNEYPDNMSYNFH